MRPLAQELNDKFAADGGGFDMAFGDQADYFNGPEVRLGTPWPRILEGMVSDHVDQVDLHLQ